MLVPLIHPRTVVQVIDKPRPQVFTGNTRDSSGVNPQRVKPEGFIWTVLLSVYITRKHLCGVVWLVCTTAACMAYKLLPCFSPLPCSLCYQMEHSADQLLARTVACITANKPSITSCFLHALTMFYSSAWNTHSSKYRQQISWQISLSMLLALAHYWSQGVWIISQVPLTPGLSYRL